MFLPYKLKNFSTDFDEYFELFTELRDVRKFKDFENTYHVL